MLSPFAERLRDYLRAGYPALAVVTHEEERLLGDLRTLSTAGWARRDVDHGPRLGRRGRQGPEPGAGRPPPGGAGPGDAAREDGGGLLRPPSLPRPAPGTGPRRAGRVPGREGHAAAPALLLARAHAARGVGEGRRAAGLPLAVAGGPPRPPRRAGGPREGHPAARRARRHARSRPRPHVERGRERVRPGPDARPGADRGDAGDRAGREDRAGPEIRTPGPPRRRPRRSTAVGGLAPLKAWIAGQGALLARAAEALAWGFAARDLPKGVLLLGVPGTGKSLLARAIAGSWGLPLLRLEMARVLGSLVGQSEARTQSALRLAEAMAPCVLHVDEIEKTLAGAGAGHLDSGVSSRVVGSLLTWLQERGLGRDGTPAPVFVVATANRVEALPPELFRPGRFDQVFFLDLPEPAERAAVLEIHLRARRQTVPGDAIEAARRAHRGVQRGRARAGRQGGVPARVPGRRPPPASRGPRGRARERHAAGGEPRRGDRRDPWVGADPRPARQRPRRARRRPHRAAPARRVAGHPTHPRR